MAIIKQDDEKEVNAPTMGAPSGVNAPAAPTKQASSSGRFTNLQRYMSANQGNQLGQRVVGNINKAAEQTKQQLQTGQQEFAKQAGEAASAFQGGQNIQEKIKTGAEGLTADEIAKAQAMRDAAYKGPQELGNIQALKSGVQNVGQAAAGTASEAGRQNLLKTMFAKQGYNTGQQRLDQLLLQGAQPTLNQTRQTAGRLSREVGQADLGARTQAQGLATEAADVQKATRGAIEGAVTGLETELTADKTGRLSTLTSKQQQDLEETRRALENGLITQSMASALGFDRAQTGAELDLLDVSPESFVRASDAPTLKSIISAQEAARINALRNLAGSTLGGEKDQFLQQFGPEAKAGTYDPTSSVVGDREGFQERLKQSKAIMENYANEHRATQTKLAEDKANLNRIYGAELDKAKADLENYYRSGGNNFTQESMLKQKVSQLTEKGNREIAAIDAIAQGKANDFQKLKDMMSKRKVRVVDKLEPVVAPTEKDTTLQTRQRG